MIWKSAPNGSTLPLISPLTSPPTMGMMRRTPWPMSPAVVTSAMRAVMVKMYFVSSVGVIAGFSVRHHTRRQPGGEQRERDQDHQADQVGRHKGNHAAEDGGERDVLHHALDDKDVHADRRMDEAELDRHHDDDAEPDRIEAEMHDDGEDDRHREADHRHRIHQAAEYEIHHHDQCQHAVGPEPKPGEKLC